jgi:hypothetical protein
VDRLFVGNHAEIAEGPGKSARVVQLSAEEHTFFVQLNCPPEVALHPCGLPQVAEHRNDLLGILCPACQRQALLK